MSALRISSAQPLQPLDFDLDPGSGPAGDPADAVLRILRFAAKLGASDIHLRAGTAPMVRLDGEIRHLKHARLTVEFIDLAITALAASAGVGPDALQGMQTDFSCIVDQAGRFRAHMYRQAGTTAVVLRRIQDPIPDFATLRLPPVVKRIAMADRGLVFVVGATGNGKSTTVASMLEYINQNATKHIVTFEDPQEFVFRDAYSTFSQREVGRDVASFEAGLQGVLREDPDVIFIGELRTVQSLEIALSAAESGRLVVSTCHSPDSSRTIARIVNMYPVDQRDSVRNRLADALVGVIAQRLLPRLHSRARVLVSEVLTSSPTVRDCIREVALFRGLNAALSAGTHEHGSHSMDQMLISMVRDGVIALEVAQAAATQPNELLRSVKAVR